jgi:hypothetical protein
MVGYKDTEQSLKMLGLDLHRFLWKVIEKKAKSSMDKPIDEYFQKSRT